MSTICKNTTDPFTTALIASWLESLRMEAARAGVTLADLRESQLNIPTVAADYDADRAIGRIAVWVTGEFDFEALLRSTGEPIFFRHESTVSLGAPELYEAYRAFLKSMAHPDEGSD